MTFMLVFTPEGATRLRELLSVVTRGHVQQGKGPLSVGKALLRLRLDRGLTQAEAARRAGLAPSYLSRIENGRIEPTVGMLGRIAGGLGVAVTSVFEVRAAPRGHRCPVSASGRCIGEQIRSHHGMPPGGGKARYGREELRILRMADFLALHGGKEVRRSLAVLLEALVARAGGPGALRTPMDQGQRADVAR
jgi:DNA-binding XRE family transcriptional regulator